MRNHVPGPWKWDEHGNLRGWRHNAVINPRICGNVLSAINYGADARLITAAPDLLAAAQNAYGILRHEFSDTDPNIRAACDLLWNAIIKAKGE